jgi:hypothetical protein
MPKRIVVIEWDVPDEISWLNKYGIELALSSYCKNTKFKVTDLEEEEDVHKNQT